MLNQCVCMGEEEAAQDSRKKGENMEDFITVMDFLSYFEMTLRWDAEQRSMGRVNHLQIFALPEEAIQNGISHAVRFYDGRNHRQLLGKAYVEAESSEGRGIVLNLDMGGGKIYQFRRLRG